MHLLQIGNLMTYQDDCSPDRGRQIKLKKCKNYGSNYGCKAQEIEQASHESGKGSGLSFTRARTTLARYETLRHYSSFTWESHHPKGSAASIKTQCQSPPLPLLAMLRHGMMRQCYARTGSSEPLYSFPHPLISMNLSVIVCSYMHLA